MAHIVAASEEGPRADKAMTEKQLANIDNLILLCPSCHTVIDKKPQAFPKDLISNWKKEHEDRVRTLFDIPRFEDRRQAHDFAQQILLHNGRIFQDFGPYSGHALDPMTDAVDIWRRRVLQDILPNNRRLVMFLERHRDLLTGHEQHVVAQFRVHVDEFEAGYVLGIRNAAAPRFPLEVTQVFS